MAESLIAAKAYNFALRIVRLYRHLVETQREYVLTKQLIRCGTSIGANTEEAVAAQSPADFISKLSIARKEARETNYWLRLLCDAEYLERNEFESLQADCQELIRMLTSIILTTKKKQE